jgi:hypothetical protein
MKSGPHDSYVRGDAACHERLPLSHVPPLEVLNPQEFAGHYTGQYGCRTVYPAHCTVPSMSMAVPFARSLAEVMLAVAAYARCRRVPT